MIRRLFLKSLQKELYHYIREELGYSGYYAFVYNFHPVPIMALIKIEFGGRYEILHTTGFLCKYTKKKEILSDLKGYIKKDIINDLM